MDDYPKAIKVLKKGSFIGSLDHVSLDYEARFMRRKRLRTGSGAGMLVDLPEVTNLSDGDAFELEDGRRIEIRAALEPVLVIRGDLTRFAWHIGNRHTPCQIEADHILILRDHVLQDMLAGLGARTEHTEAAFTPEGGAYGHGRTHSHDH